MNDDTTIPADRGPSSLRDTAILPDQVPEPIGGYGFLRPLGEGGMGVVYLARQPKFDRLVAVKLMKGMEKDARERFWREARIAGALSHPNIVQVFDVGEDRGRLYLAMEYIEGVSLAEKLRADGPMPEAQALAVVAQVARALSFAHGKGVIHRDVKPANILLTPQGLPKLADLGLARNLTLPKGESLTASGVVLGSVQYMSPEQMDDPRKADARSDIYSLGATLYQMLTGRAPFDAESVVKMAIRHATDPRPDPRAIIPAITEDTVRICRRMMAIDPRDRYADMAEVVEACSGSVGFATTVQGVFRPPKEGGSRHARIVGASILAAVLGSLALSDWVRHHLRVPAGPACYGKAERLPDGRWRFVYDFDDPAQLADWQPQPDSDGKAGKFEVHDGALWASGGRPAVARFRHDLRVERVRMTAACLEGEWSNHINLYLNSRWEGNWEGNWGVSCILRGDGMVFCVDGKQIEEGLKPSLAVGTAVEEEVTLSKQGDLRWTVDGAEVHQAHVPRVAGRAGSLLIGAFEASIRIDRIEFEGTLATDEELKEK